MNQDRFHQAVRDGCLEILYDASKKDANHSDDDGFTPTLLAAFCGHLDALRILAGRGGDPEKTTLLGLSGLHLAVSKGHLNCVSFLINFGVNMWCLDNDLRTAKDIASMNENKEILDRLNESMAKQSALNTKTVQKFKEKAIIAAEKRIKSFRKLQLKAIKQSEKEERDMHKRNLFSASSTSDINLVGTSMKSSMKDIYQFNDQFSDNLQLKSARSVYHQENRGFNIKSSKHYNVGDVTSDGSSNTMKFSDIVNNKMTPSNQTVTNPSISSESTIRSKIRSIGGVSRKVHLKKLLQTISSNSDNQQSFLAEYKVRQSDESGNIRLLSGFRRDDQILYAPNYERQSSNVNTKKQRPASVLLPASSKDIDINSIETYDTRYEANNSFDRTTTESFVEGTGQKLEVQQPSVSRYQAEKQQEFNQPLTRSNHGSEKIISRAFSVPDFTSEIFIEKERQGHHGEYTIDQGHDDEDGESCEKDSRYSNIRPQAIGENRSILNGKINMEVIRTSSKMMRDPFNQTTSHTSNQINDDRAEDKSIQKKNGNFVTLDDSIGSAGSLAQRNTASTTSSPSNTKYSPSSLSSDNTFESISVQTDESSLIFDNHHRDKIFLDKNNLPLGKIEYLGKNHQLSMAAPKEGHQNNNQDFEQNAIDMFLATNGLIDLKEVLRKEKIDLEALMLLTEDDLKSLDILLGPRKKLLKAIRNRSIQLYNPNFMMDTPL